MKGKKKENREGREMNRTILIRMKEEEKESERVRERERDCVIRDINFTNNVRTNGSFMNRINNEDKIVRDRITDRNTTNSISILSRVSIKQ